MNLWFTHKTTQNKGKNVNFKFGSVWFLLMSIHCTVLYYVNNFVIRLAIPITSVEKLKANKCIVFCCNCTLSNEDKFLIRWLSAVTLDKLSNQSVLKLEHALFYLREHLNLLHYVITHTYSRYVNGSYTDRGVRPTIVTLFCG